MQDKEQGLQDKDHTIQDREEHKVLYKPPICLTFDHSIRKSDAPTPSAVFAPCIHHHNLARFGLHNTADQHHIKTIKQKN
ncbi:MAG: hypothetical protein EOO88_51125 [Pedobacter sp.]|nr:MAG: hypothetical protein EOO88_51125 [Pedobacter sp.]